MAWLGSKMTAIYTDHSVISSFDDFCHENSDDKITKIEWRIIYRFGFAGKLWNTNEIYVTGASSDEIGKAAYNRQQKIIEQWNEELKKLLATYA